MKVRKEVKELCLEFRKCDTKSKRFEELERILKNKYKFTAFNLLALWQDPPTIEYTMENIDLIRDIK